MVRRCVTPHCVRRAFAGKTTRRTMFPTSIATPFHTGGTDHPACRAKTGSRSSEVEHRHDPY
jgi:hypothetical protein